MAEINFTEHQEAVVFAEYLQVLQNTRRIMVFSHVPQETFTKNWGTKTRNRQEGVRKGVPDYIVVSDKKILFVELKRRRGGNIKPDQKIWIDALEGKTSSAKIAKGFDEAVQFIEDNI